MTDTFNPELDGAAGGGATSAIDRIVHVVGGGIWASLTFAVGVIAGAMTEITELGWLDFSDPDNTWWLDEM